MQSGDAEHGVVDTVAFEAAVAQDLPGLHTGEDVLDTRPDFTVGSVVLLLPRGKFVLAALPAVRDDQARAPVSAVGDDNGFPDSGLGSGQFPCLAVVAVAGRGRPTATTSRVSASITTWWLVEYR